MERRAKSRKGEREKEDKEEKVMGERKHTEEEAKAKKMQ